MPAQWISRIAAGLLAGLIFLSACAAWTGVARQPAVGDTRVRQADGMVLVYVPAGEFQMGIDKSMALAAKRLCAQYSTPDIARASCSLGVFTNEQPAHTVRLDAFWLDQSEVTNGQYQLCETAGACTPPVELGSFTRAEYYRDPQYASYPVIWVNWGQAAAYCEWAGARLPSEAEWEYAARSPQNWIFPWGDRFDPARLNYCDQGCEGISDPSFNDGFPDTAPVGSFPQGASWVGALDLAGNVREWVATWYEPYPSESVENPQGPQTGSSKIPRGGSWYDRPDDTRSTNRGENTPDYTRHKVGFRCAMD